MTLNPPLTRAAWQRVKTIAAAAWSQPPDLRAELVERESGGDPIVLSEVQSLLDAMESVGERFETPAASGVNAALAAEPSILSGTRVGSWVIVRELGHGGMGTVYLVERSDAEFRQRGALKVARGFADEDLIRRFREERRILATLEHADIARLIDGGTTSAGMPYVVLEYVEGLAIDEFCATHRLDVRERVELFRRVCAAVHYAHQRLVIHRDIKTSNILVTDDGSPKLLDFGIAKMLEAEHPAEPTRTMLRMITPENASPEQVTGDTITTATDVYGLGVLLYRLLSGRSPHRLTSRRDTDVIRVICHETPPPPSAVAQERLRGDVKHDLDLIVLKALRKEPDRRYSSAEQLSDDLGRFLDGHPVAAAPDSTAYRAAKFFSRHRGPVLFGAIAALLIVAASIVAIYQARVARRQRMLAERRFADVRQLANSFVFEVHDAIADLPGSLKARQLVVKRAAEYLDKLAQASTGETDLQRELAGANERLGEILGGGGVSNLGDLRGADARYGTALAMREALASNSQATPADVEALAQLHVSLSRFKALAGDLPRAEAHASRAVDLLESPLARQSTDPHRLGYLARAQHQRGYVRARRGNNETAVASHREATQNARRQVELLPDDDQEQARLARIEVDYAETLRYTGDDAQALAMIADARQRAERLLKADPHNQRLRMTLFQAFYNEGEVYEDQEHWSACLEAFRRAVALADELRTAQPDDVSSQLTAIHAYYALGMGFIHSGAIVRGIAVLDEAVAGAQHLLRTMPNNAYVLSQLSGIEVERGEALLGIHRTADGCRDIRSGMEVWARLDRTGSMPGDSARNRQHYAELLTRCPQS